MLLALAMAVLIEDYATLDTKVPQKVTIEDDKVARFLAAAIEKVPDGGEMMKSFGPKTRHVKLTFTEEGGKRKVVEFYRGMLKTKTTGFNAPTTDLERTIYRDVLSLFEAKYGEALLLVPGHTYKFPDGDLTYEGESTPAAEKGAPTVTASTRTFKASEAVKITWTQQPPANQVVKLGKKSLTLVSFDREKDLFPYRFLLR